MKEDPVVYWLRMVLQETAKAQREMTPKVLHDLRVAIRRSRSIASGYKAVDHNPVWKEIEKSGKVLFKSLAALREVHVMKSWVINLSTPKDPSKKTLLRTLNQMIRLESVKARQAIEEFNLKQWRRWMEELPHHLKKISVSENQRMQLTAKRWSKAYQLHRQAVKSENHEIYHQLRIALKRFRYTVESFLPREYKRWEDKLKLLQDLLGEIHDLDMLQALIEEEKALDDTKSKKRWAIIIRQEQNKRLKSYKQYTHGKQSLWIKWREEINVIPA